MINIVIKEKNTFQAKEFFLQGESTEYPGKAIVYLAKGEYYHHLF